MKLEDSDNFRTQIVKLPAEMRKGLEIGASVANNGVCLTVTEIHDDLVSFDLMQETLRITNLGSLKQGILSISNARCKWAQRLVGIFYRATFIVLQAFHRLSKAKIIVRFGLKLPNKDVMKYILTKGFIAIDGISLTIGEVKDDEFCVNLIP